MSTKGEQSGALMGESETAFLAALENLYIAVLRGSVAILLGSERTDFCRGTPGDSRGESQYFRVSVVILGGPALRVVVLLGINRGARTAIRRQNLPSCGTLWVTCGTYGVNNGAPSVSRQSRWTPRKRLGSECTN